MRYRLILATPQSTSILTQKMVPSIWNDHLTMNFMIPITSLWLLLMLECLVCPAQLMFGLQVCTGELLCFLFEMLPLEEVLMKFLQHCWALWNWTSREIHVWNIDCKSKKEWKLNVTFRKPGRRFEWGLHIEGTLSDYQNLLNTLSKKKLSFPQWKEIKKSS